MPILKPLGQSGPQAKRRSRSDLTREMISAPLGDFRHTMHVGRGGEAFGDTSFLSKRREGGRGEEEEGEERGGGADGLRALPEEQEEEQEGEGQPEGGCGGQRAAQQGAALPPSSSSSSSSSPPPPPDPSTGSMRAAESVLSLFQVDLGPSMLSEVLGVMEKGAGPSDRTLGTRGPERVGEPVSPSVRREQEGQEEEEEDEEEGQGNFTFEEEDEEIGV